MAAELPIDVNYKQLVPWLQARQKLQANWTQRLTQLQAKATQCYKELPADVLAQLRGGDAAAVDYWLAVAVRDLLSRSSQRSLLGGLTGAAATWDKIVRVYEKDGASS
jgi:hypothetical protein